MALGTLIGLAGVLVCAGGAAHADCLQLINGTVIDPAARTATRTHLVIRDGKVAARSEEQPAVVLAGCDAIDVNGKFILPALADLHIHSWGNRVPTWVDDEEFGTAGTSRHMLYAGVGAFLDLGGDEDKILPLKKEWSSKGAPGARMFAAGPVLGADLQADKAEERIAKLVAEGADVIKVLHDTTGGEGYQATSRAQLAAIVAAAHKHDRKVVMHIGSWDDAREGIEVGVDLITHLKDEVVIPDALVKLWADKKVLSIPTMAVQCDLYNLSRTPSLLDTPLGKALTTDRLRKAYRNKKKFIPGAKMWLTWQPLCKKIDFESLRKLHRGGVVLLTGSDTGNLGTIQGFSLHRELELFAEAGLPAMDVLAAATSNAAKFLGQKWGVTIGDRADLLILRASPLVDMNNTQAIDMVIRDGKPVDRALLTK